MKGVIYVSNSDNVKIAGSKKVDATYASITKTCSHTCPLKDEGCYAQSSFVGMIVKKLNKRARQHSPLEIARAEAQAIDQSYHGKKVPDGRLLRIHISGDSRSIKGTRLISKAVDRWLKRGTNGKVWSYTHSWSHVPRKEWGQVSVLGSIESTSQVEQVRKLGYAPALVVAQHPSEKAYKLPGADTLWIPCPAQTKPGGKEIACSECQLCMKADWLFATNKGISFSAHGVKANSVKKHLNIIQ